MIDRLEEVLGKTDSGEEASRLEEQLRQRRVAAPLSAEEQEGDSCEPIPTGQITFAAADSVTAAAGQEEIGAAGVLPEQTAWSELLRGTEPVALPCQDRAVESQPEWEEDPPSSALREKLSVLSGETARAVVNGAAPYRGQADQCSVPAGKAEAAAELAALVGRAAERLPVGTDRTALLALYHQTAQASVPMGGAGGFLSPTVIREGSDPGSGLSVQELDLAVRRDSRRYDGAVHIY